MLFHARGQSNCNMRPAGLKTRLNDPFLTGLTRQTGMAVRSVFYVSLPDQICKLRSGVIIRGERGVEQINAVDTKVKVENQIKLQ